MNLISLKKCITIVFLLFGTVSLLAQSPERMSYQSIVRNTNGELVADVTVGVKVSIVKDSGTGTVVYEETFVGNTNENGLLTLEIGGGVPVTGTFSGINWGTGIYFVKTETDPNGGTNYTITGIGQLLSVPYAFYASTSSNQGKTTIILTGDITDAEATEQIDRELGYNTENIIISETTQLTTVDFTGATNLLSITISENTALTEVRFSTLKTVFKEFMINSNLALTSLDFPMLRKVDGIVWTISSNPVLTSISFPLFEKFERSALTISSNDTLTQVNFPVATKMGGLNINSNPVLTAFNAPQVTDMKGVVGIQANPNFTTLNLGSLQIAQGVSISNTSLTSVAFPQLTSLSTNFYLDNNPTLQSVSLPLLNNSVISIANSPLFSSLNLDGLITGSLSIGGSGMTSFSLPPNFIHAGTIDFRGNNNLISLSLIGIQTINESIIVAVNPTLTSITFPEAVDFTTVFSSSNINLENNALTSASVNDILQKMLTAIPLANKSITLNDQTPPAPPTGQGLIDKQTLIDNNNTVVTD
jgi:hypothetical protein